MGGVAEHIRFTQGDFNTWRAGHTYAAIIANQSLHHVLDLENLFDEVKSALPPHGLFICSDMIGRNGHQRWPEALVEVQKFWEELPAHYRYNRQLRRHEDSYENWDCSGEGFEGIRAQDILRLLIDRFDFSLFIGFGSTIDVFIDRSFGHNFDAAAEWDRDFIDRVHAFDEAALRSGRLTPTHMLAVMSPMPVEAPLYSRGLSPARCVRQVARYEPVRGHSSATSGATR